jgi:hypothetical protein
MAFFCQCLFDGLRHLQLSAAKFVRRVCARQNSARREELMQRGIFAPGKGTV